MALNEAIVRRMRLQAQQGRTARELADEHDCGVETVRRILRWETWRKVSEVGPGASETEWAALSKPEAVAESQARLLASLAGEPSGVGLARLQHEGAVQKRVDNLIKEIKGE